jgi:hypothetical protein
MGDGLDIAKAIVTLKQVYKRAIEGDEAVNEIRSLIDARDNVVTRYQVIFSQNRIDSLTEIEMREFLQFKNNQHWFGLQRMGPAICGDMGLLRSALKILLDENQSIADRLNKLIPGKGPAYVPRLSRAVLTPILMISHPKKYGVWNNVSESGMKLLNVWPDFDVGTSFGNKYAMVNDIMVELAEAVGVDLWILDALWWRLEGETTSAGTEVEDPVDDAQSVKFGLERHLHEFLRDNWAHTELGADWVLYEEDGEPEAGYEYPTDVGRIDLLARHKTEKRWLVLELKRHQSSDNSVAQLLRYMGWVKKKLTTPEDSVEGIIISHTTDEKMSYSLSMVPNVRLMLYEVDFRLKTYNPF